MYQKMLSSVSPGLIIIMIDQSGSMCETYADSSKSEFSALAVNRIIGEIISSCNLGEAIKDRCYVAVIGYKTNMSGTPDARVLFLNKVSELAKNTNTISIKKKIPDGAGGLVEVDQIMQIFVKPEAQGGTPMAQAFSEAYKGAKEFINSHPDSFPPIVINVTDGEPSDFGSAKTEAEKLLSLETSDGKLLLFNIHISNGRAGRIELPSDDSSFGGDHYANFLFEISSILPEPMVVAAKNQGFQIKPNMRGFMANADAEGLIKFLTFGTIGALR